MANCNTQQLNITCGTDVVLHDRLIFEGETFDPNLSVGIAANLVSSLGKRTALDVQVVDDELLISVPWVDGTLPGCYGLEVTGSCNSKKWATYADSLIKYTKATRLGVSEVTVESDSYDITQEVGYCYSNSPVTFAEVTVDDGYGTPSVDVEYEQRALSMAFHNLKGNGITDIDVDEQVGDEAVNTVTIKTDADQEGTEFQVRNGSRGNGIASSSESLSDQDGGTNTFTITDDDGNTHEFHSKNGTKGSQGDSAVYDPSSPDAPDFVMANTTGDSTTKAMTQKAVTDELNTKPSIVDVSNIMDVDMVVTDEKGNILLELSNGNIFIKNFSNAPLKGKKVSFIGDSITTFAGYPGVVNPYYDGTNAGVSSVDMTWWKHLCDMQGASVNRVYAYGGGDVVNRLCLHYGDLYSNGSSGTPPDVIFILGGINDWYHGQTLGEITDVEDSNTTFYAAYKYLLKNLISTYPNSQIVGLTPLNSMILGTNVPYLNSNNASIRDFSEAVIECCDFYSVPSLDVNKLVNINGVNYTQLLADYTHPNLNGMGLLTKSVSKNLNNLFVF